MLLFIIASVVVIGLIMAIVPIVVLLAKVWLLATLCKLVVSLIVFLFNMLKVCTLLGFIIVLWWICWPLSVGLMAFTAIVIYSQIKK